MDAGPVWQENPSAIFPAQTVSGLVPPLSRREDPAKDEAYACMMHS